MVLHMRHTRTSPSPPTPHADQQQVRQEWTPLREILETLSANAFVTTAKAQVE